jgi:hypothetical protein
LHYFSLIFGVDAGIVVVHPVLLHQEGDDEGGTSGHAHLAVDQHVVVLEHGLDVSMGLVEVGVDAFVLIVLQVYPLAVLNSSLLDLFPDAVVVVGPLVDDAQHAVDPQIGDQIGLVEGIDATQIEVPLVGWGVLLVLENVYDVTAVLVVVHCVQERIIIQLVHKNEYMIPTNNFL